MKFKEEIKKILESRKTFSQLMRSRLSEPLFSKNGKSAQHKRLQEEQEIQNILDLLD